FAIFARTGASLSPAAGASRKIPPICSRLSLKAARSDAGQGASNSGTAGSGRFTFGRFARMDAKISSRLLIACFRDWCGTSYGMSAWADAAPHDASPGVEAVVNDEAREMGERDVSRGDSGAISGRP